MIKLKHEKRRLKHSRNKKIKEQKTLSLKKSSNKDSPNIIEILTSSTHVESIALEITAKRICLSN